MPDKSAPTLMVLAIKSAAITVATSHLGNLAFNAAVRPRPLTMPIRAHIICTDAIRGHVMSAVQRRLVPNWAPATEYVAIPDGSSSAAPAIRPGPRESQTWVLNQRMERLICHTISAP